MTNDVALSGRAIFDPDDVAFDTEATGDERGPFFAWMLFTWKVNEMVPEVFATKGSRITIEDDSPARGWITEKYERARIMHPPADSGSQIMIQADDVRLYPIWDAAMRHVMQGDMHKH